MLQKIEKKFFYIGGLRGRVSRGPKDGKLPSLFQIIQQINRIKVPLISRHFKITQKLPQNEVRKDNVLY
jgi:hypothetical protein